MVTDRQTHKPKLVKTYSIAFVGINIRKPYVYHVFMYVCVLTCENTSLCSAGCACTSFDTNAMSDILMTETL